MTSPLDPEKLVALESGDSSKENKVEIKELLPQDPIVAGLITQIKQLESVAVTIDLSKASTRKFSESVSEEAPIFSAIQICSQIIEFAKNEKIDLSKAVVEKVSFDNNGNLVQLNINAEQEDGNYYDLSFGLKGRYGQKPPKFPGSKNPTRYIVDKGDTSIEISYYSKDEYLQSKDDGSYIPDTMVDPVQYKYLDGIWKSLG